MKPLYLAALLLLFAEACLLALVRWSNSAACMPPKPRWVFFRNFFALLVMIPWILTQGVQILKTRRWYLHLSRATTGIISMYCFFYIIGQLPLAQAMLVLLLSPFVVPVIAYFWLKERPGRLTLLAIVSRFLWCFPWPTAAWRARQSGHLIDWLMLSHFSGTNQNHHPLYVGILNRPPALCFISHY